ncbi:MAG: right-handed parallel beta-helix repeat-containing protein [Saprospiraceae bacterium]|nr:right-handed parallel beta-helix repeat-containing protein [Saprospiraceae bacterium]
MKILQIVLLMCIGLTSCKTESATPNSMGSSIEELNSQNPQSNSTNEAEAVTPFTGTPDTVVVSTLEGLVENAKSNTVILLEKGTYSLEENLVYLMTKDERKIIDKNVTQTRSLGGQLFFSGLSNFHIIAKDGVNILSYNPIAPALYLIKGTNVSFSNFTIRKAKKGNADVVAISTSKDIQMDKINIKGGGSYGMNIFDATNLTITNSEITKCTKGGLTISNSKEVKIINSSISDNTCLVPVVNLYGNDNIVFMQGVTIKNNTRDVEKAFQQSDRIFAVGANSLLLEGCTIENNPGFTILGAGKTNLVNTEFKGLKMQ